MPKFHALEALAGLAAAAAIVAPGLPAQARTLPLSGIADTHLVASSAQTPVYFRALPDARCFIGAGPSRTITVYANDDGIVRFDARPGRGAAPSIRLIAACDAGNREVTVPLNIQAVAGAVHPMRPAPVIDRALNAPRGFNPVTASDDDLDRYGYPPRPNQFANPEAYAEWLRAVTVAGTRVAPTGVLRPDRIHGPAHFDGNSQSYNWSGMVALGANGQFTKAVGEWVVPAVFTDDAHTPAYSSLWVGLDGDTSGDIIQDGSESDAVVVLGWLITSYYVWIEYYPDSGSTELSNFDVSPGDQLYMSARTCRNKKNQLLGCFYLVDFTQGERTSAAERPPNAKFTGNNAEWILERPTVNGRLWYLPNYILAATTDMLAYDTIKQRYVKYGSESYDTLDMYGRISGDLLSHTMYDSASVATLFWQDYN